jgi:anti-sigma factor RsiW
MANDKRDNEMLLIDYLLGQCDEAQAEEVRRRLEADPALRRLHDDLRNTFSAMDLAPQAEPPEDLAERTLARIRSAKQTDALLAREELSRRDVIRPTFSLVELGAVAGVVLLLISVFGVSYREARRRQDRAQCAANVARLGSGLLTYANKNNRYLPMAAASAPRNWLPKNGRPAVSNSSALYLLVAAGYVDPPAFLCPAVGGRTFVVKMGMTDFPGPTTITYSYQYSLDPGGLSIEDRRLAKVKVSFAILSDTNPVFANGEFHPERVAAPVSDNHDREGQNVLYPDMHVAFKRRASVGVNGNNIYIAEGIYEYDGDEAPTDLFDSFLLPAFIETQGYEAVPDSSGGKK